MRNFVDLEIKHLLKDEVPSYLDARGLQHVYYLRYRYFVPDGDDSEMELLFPTFSSCLLKLTQLLFNYYYLFK